MSAPFDFLAGTVSVRGGPAPSYAAPNNASLFDTFDELQLLELLPFYGPGFIAGIVKVLSNPAARTVRLYDRTTGKLLRDTTSDNAGAYRFEHLALGRKYLAVAFDDAGNPAMYNAAVADMVEAGT